MAAKQLSRRQLFLFLGDIGIVLFAFDFALRLRMGQTLLSFRSFQQFALVFALVIAYVFSFYVFDFYNIRKKFRSPEFLASMGGAFKVMLQVKEHCP